MVTDNSNLVLLNVIRYCLPWILSQPLNMQGYKLSSNTRGACSASIFVLNSVTCSPAPLAPCAIACKGSTSRLQLLNSLPPPGLFQGFCPKGSQAVPILANMEAARRIVEDILVFNIALAVQRLERTAPFSSKGPHSCLTHRAALSFKNNWQTNLQFGVRLSRPPQLCLDLTSGSRGGRKIKHREANWIKPSHPKVSRYVEYFNLGT